MAKLGIMGIIFPGQGTQNVGMGKILCEKFPEIRSLYHQASEILGYDLEKLSQQGPLDVLTESRYCQPALFVHQYALAHLLIKYKNSANIDVVGGLSIGELTALAIAEVYDFATGVQLVKKRGEVIQAACENTSGSMVSVIGVEPSELETICQKSGAEMSNINTVGQIVLSGTTQSIDDAIRLIAENLTAKTVRLNVAGAFHSSLMKPAADEFASYLANVDFCEPRVPVLSNVTGKIYTNAAEIKQLLPVQIVSAVQWLECMLTAKNQGIFEFFQCGNGKVLVNLAKRIDPALKVSVIEDSTLFDIE